MRTQISQKFQGFTPNSSREFSGRQGKAGGGATGKEGGVVVVVVLVVVVVVVFF